MSRRTLAVAAAALAVALALGLWRPWREPPGDEERIVTLFLEAARAAEEKRVGDAVEGVSERYRGEGLDRRGVKRLVAAQMLRGEWVSVTVAGTRVKLEGDAAEAVKKLKAGDGPDLQVHGSGNLIQTLLQHDLVDEFWLKVFPVTLGAGKRLFGDGVMPAAFKMTGSKVSPSGVIVANFERAGDVKTGSF